MIMVPSQAYQSRPVFFSHKALWWTRDLLFSYVDVSAWKIPNHICSERNKKYHQGHELSSDEPLNFSVVAWAILFNCRELREGRRLLLNLIVTDITPGNTTHNTQHTP